MTDEQIAEAIAKEMPRGYISTDDIVDSAYGTCKRLFGADTARLMFFHTDGFDRIMVDAYIVS